MLPSPRVCRLFLVCGCLLSVSFAAFGQTNRYWPVNFDQESFLLSGAVVAGGSSLGSIYYNPASIAFMGSGKVSLNSSIFTFNWFVFKNGLGDGLDVRFSQISVLPPYVSFLVKSKRTDRLSVELAVFTKEDQDLNVQEGAISTGDFLPAVPGNEVQDLFYNYSQRFVNLWVGAGLGYRLSDRLSIGLSNFIMMKSKRYINTLDINVFPLNDSITINGIPSRYFSSGIENREVTQSFNGQLRWKFGLTYKHDRGSLGITLTSPSVNVFSNAQSSLKFSTSNLQNEDGSFQDDLLLVDQADGLSSDFKDPFSIAIGATYLFPRRDWEIYLTAEFFAGIPRYATIRGRPNPEASRPSILEQLGTEDVLTQFRGAVPVFNVALGLKHPLPNNHFVILGMRTDFSSLHNFDYRDAPAVNIPIEANYDVFHVTSGYQFNFLKTKWVIGLEYALGRREIDFHFANASSYILDIGPAPAENSFQREETMQARYNAISVFLGFDFDLGKGRSRGNPEVDR